MARTSATIETRDGKLPVSIIRPSGSGPWPAVLLFMDAFGPRPALFEIGERIAAHGYLALVPDLFYRVGPYETPDIQRVFADQEYRQQFFAKLVAPTTQANVMADVGACLEFLAKQPDVQQPYVGTSGYCMGGGFSLAAAALYPDRVIAAASYHGGRLATDAPESPHLLAPKMKARIYVAGAVEDASFPDDMKQRLIDALTQAGVDHRVETYEGARHGWVLSDTPAHHPVMAARHDETLLALLDAKLKAK